MRTSITTLLLALLLAVPSIKAQNSGGLQADSITASLITCSPGTQIYELYGHTALRVANHTQGTDLVFNYGLFDFNTPHFAWRFALGQTDYLLGTDYFKNFKREYVARGSSIWEQRLNLTAGEVLKLTSLLLENRKPENRIYRYNFLLNNCATMALDKIEECIEGHVTYSGSEDESSFRTLIHRYSTVQPWSEFASDFLVGADADRPITLRQHAFAPLELKILLEGATITTPDGECRPLVLDTVERERPEKPLVVERPLLTPIQTAWIFLLVVTFISLFDWHRRRITWWVDLLLLVIQGLAGAVTAFVFFFSVHPTVGSNWSVVVLNPIPLLLLPWVAIKLIRHEKSLFQLADSLVITAFLLCQPLIPQFIQPALLIMLAAVALRMLCSFLLSLPCVTNYHTKKKSSPHKRAITFTLLLLTSLPPFAFAQSVSLGGTLTQGVTQRPKLVVGIVIDQLDTDYLLKLMPILSKDGFAKIWSEGYTLTNCYHEFYNPTPAAATATLMTGCNPSTHGIVADRWYDRNLKNVTSLCTDANCEGVNTLERSSPRRLLASNLADEFKLAGSGRGKVVSIGRECESVITAAGHEADAAIWLSPSDATWATSSYYGPLPGWVADTPDWTGSVWSPVYPASQYIKLSADQSYKTFSHTFRKTDAWNLRTSPMANDMVVRAALNATRNLSLGSDSDPDLLLVNLTAAGYAGAPAEFYSIEQQDIYVRLDWNITELVNSIAELVDLDHTLFFITSTGVKENAIRDYSNTRIPTGNISMERLCALLNLYISAIYGTDTYVTGYHLNHIYLDRDHITRVAIPMHELLENCTDFLSEAGGVQRVITRRAMAGGAYDRETKFMLNSIYLDFSGDIIIETKPGWSITCEDCGMTVRPDHATNSFPCMLYGCGVRAEINHEATPSTFLAPTVAAIARIPQPNAAR